MALSKEILQNIQLLLERRTVPQGLEAYAWCEAHAAVVQELNAITKEAAQAEKNAAVEAAVKDALAKVAPKQDTPA